MIEFIVYKNILFAISSFENKTFNHEGTAFIVPILFYRSFQWNPVWRETGITLPPFYTVQ